MSAQPPTDASYSIDRRAAAQSLAPETLCAAAGLQPQWQRVPHGEAIRSVGWLQPAHPPELAVAACAAQAWLQACDDPDAAMAAANASGLRGVLAPSETVEMLATLPAASELVIGRIAEDPAEALFALREALSLEQAPTQSVYAVLAEVFGLGVLIVGPAGVGKSELALELLARGHRLVADDVAEVQRLPGDLLVGNAPALLQDFLEVRGLGVLDVARMFGREALATRRRVDFMMELLPVRDAPTDYRARLAGLRGEIPMLDLPLPTIRLPIRVGHNLATLVEAACRDQWLRLQGYRAEDAFAARQQRAIDAQSAED